MSDPWLEPVAEIRVVVHETNVIERTRTCRNHLTQYLKLSENTSVHVNIKTFPNQANVDYTKDPMTFRPYVRSESEIKHWKFTPIKQFTPRFLDNWLKELEFFEFTYTAGRHGSRYWNLLVIYLLEKHNYLPRGSAVDLHKNLTFLYHSNGDYEPWSIKQGTFPPDATQKMAEELWEEMSAQVKQIIDRIRQKRGFEDSESKLPEDAEAKHLKDAESKLLEDAESQLQAMQKSAEQGKELLRSRKEDLDDADSTDSHHSSDSSDPYESFGSSISST